MAKAAAARMWKIWTGLDSIPGLRWINRPAPETETLPPGPFHHRGNRFGKDVWGTGFPELEPPVFVFDRKLGRAPTDAETPEAGTRWLLSDPAKQLLEELDPDAFQFVPVQTVVRTGDREREGPRYWLADVIRFLDAFDMESGAFATLEDGRQLPRGLDLERFRPDVVGQHMIFRPAFWPLDIYCTNKLMRAIKASALKGFQFSGGGHLDA